jgi:hypothetical protein
MPNKCRPERWALVGGSPKAIDVDRRLKIVPEPRLPLSLSCDRNAPQLGKDLSKNTSCCR